MSVQDDLADVRLRLAQLETRACGLLDSLDRVRDKVADLERDSSSYSIEPNPGKEGVMSDSRLLREFRKMDKGQRLNVLCMISREVVFGEPPTREY